MGLGDAVRRDLVQGQRVQSELVHTDTWGNQPWRVLTTPQQHTTRQPRSAVLLDHVARAGRFGSLGPTKACNVEVIIGLPCAHLEEPGTDSRRVRIGRLLHRRARGPLSLPPPCSLSCGPRRGSGGALRPEILARRRQPRLAIPALHHHPPRFCSAWPPTSC